jgi:hypothetical protein
MWLLASQLVPTLGEHNAMGGEQDVGLSVTPKIACVESSAKRDIGPSGRHERAVPSWDAWLPSRVRRRSLVKADCHRPCEYHSRSNLKGFGSKSTLSDDQSKATSALRA